MSFIKHNKFNHLFLIFNADNYLFVREDPYAEDVAAEAAAAAPEETEEAFAQRASAFNALADEQDEEEDGYVHSSILCTLFSRSFFSFFSSY